MLCFMFSIFTNMLQMLKFPMFLIDVERENDLGKAMLTQILKLSKGNGGHSKWFGHKKKMDFMLQAKDLLFSSMGALNG